MAIIETEFELTRRQKIESDIDMFNWYRSVGQCGPVEIAIALERISKLAWEEVLELYPPSLRIDP